MKYLILFFSALVTNIAFSQKKINYILGNDFGIVTESELNAGSLRYTGGEATVSGKIPVWNSSFNTVKASSIIREIGNNIAIGQSLTSSFNRLTLDGGIGFASLTYDDNGKFLSGGIVDGLLIWKTNSFASGHGFELRNYDDAIGVHFDVIDLSYVKNYFSVGKSTNSGRTFEVQGNGSVTGTWQVANAALPFDAVNLSQTENLISVYAPAKTGGGASGVWGIDITGNAQFLNAQPASFYQNAANITSGTLANERLSSNVLRNNVSLQSVIDGIFVKAAPVATANRAIIAQENSGAMLLSANFSSEGGVKILPDSNQLDAKHVTKNTAAAVVNKTHRSYAVTISPNGTYNAPSDCGVVEVNAKTGVFGIADTFNIVIDGVYDGQQITVNSFGFQGSAQGLLYRITKTGSGVANVNYDIRIDVADAFVTTNAEIRSLANWSFTLRFASATNRWVLNNIYDRD